MVCVATCWQTQKTSHICLFEQKHKYLDNEMTLRMVSEGYSIKFMIHLREIALSDWFWRVSLMDRTLIWLNRQSLNATAMASSYYIYKNTVEIRKCLMIFICLPGTVFRSSKCSLVQAFPEKTVEVLPCGLESKHLGRNLYFYFYFEW